MKAKDIKVGGLYTAKVSGKLTTVRVDGIEDRPYGAGKAHTAFHVTNLTTGRKTTFRSAAKFRSEATLAEARLRTDKLGRLLTDALQETKGPRPADFGGQYTSPKTTEAETVAMIDGMMLAGKTSTLSAVLTKIVQDTDDAPHLIVDAKAGTGKTTTLVGGLQVLMGQEPLDAKGRPMTPSSQQEMIWDAFRQSAGKMKTVMFCAFNRSIRDELERRVPKGCERPKTLNGLGYSAVLASFKLWGGDRGMNEYRCSDLTAEVAGYKDSREMRKTEPVVHDAVVKLVNLCKMNLCDGSEEQLTELAAHYEVELNGSRKRVFELVPKVLERAKDVAKDGCVDFADQVWLPIVLDLPLRKYDLLLVDEAQDLNRCQQELVKQSGRRLVFCGDPCQPTGTRVLMADGTNKPIEELRAGDMVRSFDRRSGSFVQSGRAVTGVTRRPYDGDIITVRSGELESRYTANHYCYVLLKPIANRWAVYLMRKGDHWRVGTSLLQNGAGVVGPMARKRVEGADDVWVLSTFETEQDAKIEEFRLSTTYRVPQLLFKAPNGPYQEAAQAVIDAKWAALDRMELLKSSALILRMHGRSIDYPFNEMASKPGEFWATRPTKMRACNILPGAAVLHYRGAARYSRADFAAVDSVECKAVSGLTVYSVNVDRDHSYVADGIATFNCQAIYGFAGADSESMKRLEQELGTTERGVIKLPLTVTRRCGKAIVKEANKIVAEFEAHESNPEGEVRYHTFEKKFHTIGDTTRASSYHDSVADGDFLLCRVNAPLVSECFKFIKAGRKANIQGRDVGKGLIATIKKLAGVKGDEDSEDYQERDRVARELAAVKVETVITALGIWLDEEQRKEGAKKNPSDSRMINLQDKHDCILCFTEGAGTAGDMVAKVRSVFTDDKTVRGIRLSSIHKAKGLEAERVFLLEPEGATVPHPMAKSDWQLLQEWNLRYVAITRAIEELVYVS